MPKSKIFENKKRNAIAAVVCTLAIATVGVVLVRSHAAGFFAASEPDSGTLSGNATIVSDTTASGGKALEFNAPATGGGGGSGGGGGGGSTRPEPFPASMKPDATNTGLLTAKSSLTVVTGDQTYGPSANGQTITGKDFHGFVKVTGANITFTNCLFEGRATSSNNGLIDTEDSTGTITIKDSEFVPSNPSATIDGLWTRNANVWRVNVHGTTDGMKADSNTLVQDSYIHDMRWEPVDPNQGGTETHNDAIQTFYGESNITLRHNNLDTSGTVDNTGAMASNSAIQSSGANYHIDGNWLDGGACTVNIADHGPVLTDIWITNNRWGRHQYYTGCDILISLNTVLNQNTGNVWDDTGAPIPPPQQHN
ncbi:MAG TPA: hypothetical protein VJP80_06185 [Candidatus Saccharimonadales bacterium]|nr:hypothetical protein [Candidatus Saccharimonadales bacterium]